MEVLEALEPPRPVPASPPDVPQDPGGEAEGGADSGLRDERDFQKAFAEIAVAIKNKEYGPATQALRQICEVSYKMLHFRFRFFLVS